MIQVFLNGSEESSVKAVRTLQKFAKTSGLNMDFDKTQTVWTGSRMHSNVRLLRDMDVRWDPGIFRMFRDNFSTDVQQICEINYGKNIIRVWTTRHLTPLGKIVVFKALAISKLTRQSNSCINWWFYCFGSCGMVKQVTYKKLLFVNPMKIVT